MYLRTVRAKGAEGVELEYIRLVEAYWENGRSKQRVIANLGRKDLLAPHLENLVELLGGAKKRKQARRVAASALSRLLPPAGDRCWSRAHCGANSAWRVSLMAWRPKPAVCQRPGDCLWPIECWCWWPIDSAVRAASTRWRNGWRAILSVDGMERGFWHAGNNRVASGSILTGSKIGIARWTSCSRTKNGSKWNSLAGCATFSTSRSRWSSTT